MSCGVSLERLHINQPDMLTAAELKDISSDVTESNDSQHTSEEYKPLDLQTKCNSVEKNVKKCRKKQGQNMQRSACSVHCSDDGYGSNSISSTPDLRLTLKKVRVDNSDKEEDKCVYECHTKKPNTSQKLMVKCGDRGSNTLNQTVSAAMKERDGLTNSGKVIVDSDITGWAVAQTCCIIISYAVSIGILGISTTPGSKITEPIDTKLGVSNYVGDLTLTSKHGCSGRVRVCDFSFFVSSASPRLQVATVDQF